MNPDENMSAEEIEMKKQAEGATEEVMPEAEMPAEATEEAPVEEAAA